MLSSVSFRKFKKFTDQTIPLLPKGVSFIAGGNNSGKSSILQGLAYLSEEHQKVGLFIGLGTDYAPRIDMVKNKKSILFVEGDFDVRILQRFSEKLGIKWPDKWVEWVNKAGHKERKQIFLALQEEINDLVAFSIHDRDDKPLSLIGEQLEDKSIGKCPDNFHCKIWRRRNIESYLIWPPRLQKQLEPR